jgi:hypothetical protein
MRAIYFCAIAAGLALLVMATGVAAQDRSGLLTSVEVKQLVTSAGHPSQAPPNSARFEAGEGAPPPSDAQLRALAARARTRADHLGLAEYFEAVAERQTDAANKYTAFARLYQVTIRRTVGGDPVLHYDRMATRYRESAARARAEAAKHRQLAQVAL